MESNQLPPNKDWLAVVLVISFLGFFALAGLFGGLYLLAHGKAGDANLTSLFTITATAVGALGSMLANTRQAPPPATLTKSPATTGTSNTPADDSGNGEASDTPGTGGAGGSGRTGGNGGTGGTSAGTAS